MKDILRVKPSAVAEAYRETGLKPSKGGADTIGDNPYLSETLACGLGVMYAKLHGQPPHSVDDEDGLIAVDDWVNATFGRKYACGFISGFDGGEIQPCIPSCYREHEDFKLGRLDGIECAAAMGL